MAYSNFKNLPWKTASNNVLHNKTFEIVSNTKNNGYQRRPGSMVYNFLNKKSGNGRIKCKAELIYNQLMDYTNQCSESFLWITFWVLILHICN